MHIGTVTMAGLVWGCSEFPAPGYETARVQVALSFDAQICAGTAAEIEQWARGASASLGIDPLAEDPVLLVWGDSAVANHCDEGAKGCYLYDSHVIVAAYPAIEHELVHATGPRASGQSRSPFVEEGIAEALASFSLSRAGDDQLPSSLLGLSRDEFEAVGGRNIAGHFFRHLSETYAFDRLNELRNRVSAPGTIAEFDAAFLDLLGTTFRDAEDDWLARSPGDYTRLSANTPPADAVLVDEVTFEYRLACESQDTHGPLTIIEAGTDTDPARGMFGNRVLDVPSSRRVLVLATSPTEDEGGVNFRALACWDGTTRNTAREVMLGEPAILTLEACRWEVALWTTGVGPVEAQVGISSA